MNRIDIPRPGLIGQPDRHDHFLDPWGDRDFKGLLFGPEGLDAGVTQQAELLVRSQGHNRSPAVAGLGHVKFRSFKEFLSVPIGSGHFQDHPGAGGSAVRDAVAGLIGDFSFDHGQGLVFSLVDLEDVAQGFHLEGQGLTQAV
jgi:hypothetical protein